MARYGQLTRRTAGPNIHLMSSPSPSIGQILGHYRILEQIGAGGMGVVYRAHDERLDRDVALKVLPPGALADEPARKRFRKEALALAKLNHPSIATVYDFDTQRDVDFLVYEYIPGVTLKDKLSHGTLPEIEIARLGMQLAKALTAAHKEGVVHRDLKPANLLVTVDGQLKILDFGLAKLIRTSSEEDPTASPSETYVAAGTLAYMAPEQLRGELADLRSDIYSSGAVLYEAATGQRPFPETYVPRLIDSILHEGPRPPGRLNRRVSPALENIILKCLGKEPEQRYQSAAELHVDLERLSTPGRSPTTHTGRYRNFARRWPVFLALCLAAMLAVLMALNTGKRRGRLLNYAGTPHIQSLAVLPLENLSREPEQDYFADGMTDALIANLSKISALRVISRTSVMRYKKVRDPLPKIARELNVDAVVEGSVLQSENRVRIMAELTDAAADRNLWSEQYEGDLRDILVLQSNVAQAIAKEINIRLEPREQTLLVNTRTINPEAYQLYLKGRYYWNKRTQEGLEKSLGYFKQAIEKDPSNSLAYAGLADCYVILAGYNLRPPGEVYPLAQVAAKKALELDGTLAEAHTSLASYVWDYERNWQAGLREYERAIELNPNYATAHQWYSESLMRIGRRDEAIAEIQKAKELDPLSLVMNAVQGFVYYFARQYDQAIAQLKNTLELDTNFYPAHVFLGWNYEQKGMYAEAIAQLQTAMSLSGGSRYVTPGLAHAYAAAGQKARALELLNQLRQSSERSYVDPYDIALIYAALGDKDQGFMWLEKAYWGRSESLTFVKVDPRMDSLRSDSRFRDLLRRLNLPPD
ncbi:MAG: hypothetical protein DMG97_26115 [Acidobacteria bacterium]|nr:MAG: hypothetical protein DMG97_26115 [Acidobacteriota bacterium]